MIYNSFWNKDDLFQNKAEMFRNIVYTGISRNSYFTLSCLELKDIGDIKEIEEGETSNELGKEEP